MKGAHIILKCINGANKKQWYGGKNKHLLMKSLICLKSKEKGCIFHQKKGWIILLTVLIPITILFIFSQSLLGRDDSKQESMKVQKFVEPVLETVVGKGNVTNNLVRKLAHVIEFMVLGAELSVLSLLTGKYSIGYTMLAVVCTALCDETIQIFSKRGSQVQDVWLDIGGAVLGAIIVLLVFLLGKLIIYVRKKKNQAPIV